MTPLQHAAHALAAIATPDFLAGVVIATYTTLLLTSSLRCRARDQFLDQLVDAAAEARLERDQARLERDRALADLQTMRHEREALQLLQRARHGPPS